MPSENSDDALLARLNALRPSAVSLNTKVDLDADQVVDPNPGNDVGGNTSSIVPHNDEDDKLLDDLLQDVGVHGEWDLDRHDERDVKKLAADAHLALTSMQKDQNRSRANSNGDGDSKLSNMFKSNDDQTAVSEDEEAQEVIAKMLAELELDRNNPLSNHAGSSADAAMTASGETSEAEQEGSELTELPSAPSELPKTSRNSPTDAEDALAAHLSGLSLPGAPSFSPSKKPTKIAKSNLPTYTDEQIDSWCIICNDDATVRCIGCDGDLYCQPCWAEGHIGPDAGYEERGHRWSKYQSKRPGDGE